MKETENKDVFDLGSSPITEDFDPFAIQAIQAPVLDYDYEVHSIRLSGKSSQVLELVDTNGDMIKAYIRAADKSIKTGARLCNVHIEKKKNNYGEYNLISAYQIAA